LAGKIPQELCERQVGDTRPEREALGANHADGWCHQSERFIDEAALANTSLAADDDERCAPVGQPGKGPPDAL
jgi:hypothetical protein